MATIPDSGSLGLWQTVGVILGLGATDVSLRAASDQVGFTEPDAMSDFYGYTDAIIPTLSAVYLGGAPYNHQRMNVNFPSVGASVICYGNEPGVGGLYIGTSANYTSNGKGTYNNSINANGASVSRPFAYFGAGVGYYWTAWACNIAGEGVGPTRFCLTPTSDIRLKTNISYL